MLLVLADDPDAKVRNTADRYSWSFHCKNVRLSEDPGWDYEVTTHHCCRASLDGARLWRGGVPSGMTPPGYASLTRGYERYSAAVMPIRA